MKPNFHLDKMYFDCIDDNGNCFIIYWACLKFYWIKIHYSGCIYSDENGKSTEKSSFVKIPKPTLKNELNFNHKKLGFSILFKQIDNEITSNLYKVNEYEKVVWHCHHPKTHSEIVFLNNKYVGIGYSETLYLSIKPWKLPIDELRWGRYLSNDNSIVWINWKGKYPVNQLYLNGKLFEDAVYNQDQINFDHGKFILTFENTTVVREGKLGQILVKMPWLKTLFNNKILKTIEKKYKAKTTFNCISGKIDYGWSLFEIVTWNK